MNLVIYNINSFGGNYEYSKYIFQAYAKHQDITNCLMLMPRNAELEEANVRKILLPDIISSKRKWVKRIYYIYRSLVNPFRLFNFLRKYPSSIVLFNDFDQLTAFFWVPFFFLLNKRHHFALVLHDPDRDNFFPVKLLSKLTMQSIMSIMDVGFYHGFLPAKNYYNNKALKISVPMGLFAENSNVDKDFCLRLDELSANNSLIGILGNIRPEKNYEMVIDSLQKLDNVKLLVAGKAARSSISVDYYKRYAEDKNVSDRIIWVEDYLSQTSFNAAIQCCEIILLYYKPSFTSQSAVLSSIAPFFKKLIISNVDSSLKHSVQRFGLGDIIPHDDPDSFVKSVNKLLHTSGDKYRQAWKSYMEDSSWEMHVNIAVSSFKKVI